MTSAGAPPHPLSAGPLLRATLDLVRAHPWPLLLPLVILGLVGGAGQGASRLGDFDFGNPLRALPFLPLGVIAFPVAVALFLLNGLAWIVTTRAAFMPLRGEGPPDPGLAMDAVRPVGWRGVGAFVVWALAVALGLLLLVAPGVFLMGALVPWAAVVVAEGRGGLAALTRAWELTRGERFHLTTLALLGVGVTLAAQLLIGWIPGVGGALAGGVTGAICAATAVLAAVYYARRVGAEAGAEPTRT